MSDKQLTAGDIKKGEDARRQARCGMCKAEKSPLLNAGEFWTLQSLKSNPLNKFWQHDCEGELKSSLRTQTNQGLLRAALNSQVPDCPDLTYSKWGEAKRWISEKIFKERLGAWLEGGKKETVPGLIGISLNREELAELFHESWAGWMRYLFSKSSYENEGDCLIPAEFAKRWWRQMSLEYKNLTETERGSDREEADKFIALIENKENTNGTPKETEAQSPQDQHPPESPKGSAEGPPERAQAEVNPRPSPQDFSSPQDYALALNDWLETEGRHIGEVLGASVSEMAGEDPDKNSLQWKDGDGDYYTKGKTGRMAE